MRPNKRRKRSKVGDARRARIEAAFARACEVHQRGQWAEAAAAYHAVLERDPEFAPAYFHLALVSRSMHRLEEAVGYLDKALAVEPDSALFIGTLGNLLGELGRWEPAKALLERAHGMSPDDPTILHNLGKAFGRTGEPDRAAEAFESLVGLTPGDADAWVGLGAARLDAQDVDGSLDALREALELKPDSAAAHNNLGTVYLDLGQFEKARAAFDAALSIDPMYVKALVNRVKTRRFTPDDAPEVARIEAALERLGSRTQARGELHFALGKIQDDLGEYAAAFEHYALGNRLQRSLVPYDREARAGEVGRLKAVFDAGAVSRILALGATLDADDPRGSERAVFIVGMPRSGTSLVEQIIASHSRAAGAGELPYVHAYSNHLAQRVGRNYPECVQAVDAQTWEEGATWYLERLGRGFEPSIERISDKMPGNYNHLGLIARLFPRARIVHCDRDPMDVCWSIYRQLFVDGHPYSFDIEDLAFEYRAYRELMAHWTAVMPRRILEVRYEELVSRPDEIIPELIDFVGLEWEDACLSPHQTDRRVHTASNWQVRQPIYQTSRARWRSYEAQLAPLAHALAAGPVTG